MTASFSLELPYGPDRTAISRADLTFYGLDHSGESYQARVFFDQPEATASTPITDPGYAGTFSVLGHGGCYGEDGHCSVRDPVTTFDRRPPHPLVPATRILICTDLVQRLMADGRASVTVTVVPIVRAAGSGSVADPAQMTIDQVSLHTYE